MGPIKSALASLKEQAKEARKESNDYPHDMWGTFLSGKARGIELAVETFEQAMKDARKRIGT